MKLTLNLYNKLDLTDAWYSYVIYESISNLWRTPEASKAQLIARGSGALHIGEQTLEIDVRPGNPLMYWLKLGGSIRFPPASSAIYVAEPPFNNVSDKDAAEWGPPWISMASLAQSVRLSADLYLVQGVQQPQAIGAWAIDPW
jgi:hypothetical protein